MAEITAALVKELRESSGAGMMDCKKALTETGGDLEAATDWLRTKANSIEGGTSEVMLGIVSRRVLGLPG